VNQAQLISAQWIWTGPGQLLRDHALLVREGHIAEVAPRSHFAGRNCSETHYSRHIITPGLINAHTHLELGYLHNQLPAGPFVPWVVQLMAKYPQADAMAATVHDAVTRGVIESLRGGVTCVGDITKQTPHARAALAGTPIRAVSFGELQAIGARRSLLDARLVTAVDGTHAESRLTIGVSPHAPYTVDGLALQDICNDTRCAEMPLCMHLAELPEEADFLRDLSGALRAPYDSIGTAWVLDDSVPRHPGGPIAWAKQFGLLNRIAPTLLAHVNYASDDDLAMLAANRNVAVVYCPRTRAFFGHDAVTPHRYREMLARGINVCLGTDSLASNPDLHLLREAQLLHQRDATPAETLLAMLTVQPARALGLHGLGTLTPTSSADVAVFEIDSTAHAVESLVANAPTATAVYINGTRVQA